jgi:hypothetical protein
MVLAGPLEVDGFAELHKVAGCTWFSGLPKALEGKEYWGPEKEIRSVCLCLSVTESVTESFSRKTF